MNWNDFLNPRSMLTPGIAGSVVMVIANTLWVEFMLPQKWSALVLSFLLIIPILIKFAASKIENIIYFFFNGLIVFSLAANANFAGRTLQDVSSYPNREDIRILVQKISSPLNTSPTIATSSPSYTNQIKNNLQLASNEKGTFFIALTDQKGGSKPQEKQSEKAKEKQQQQPSQSRRDRGGRQFFDKWF